MKDLSRDRVAQDTHPSCTILMSSKREIGFKVSNGRRKAG